MQGLVRVAGLCALLPVILCCLPSAAYGGAWQQPDNRRLSIQTLEYFEASVGMRTFEQLTSRAYREWPLGDAVTFGTKLSYAWQTSTTPNSVTQLNGINEALLFASHHWVREGGWAFASRMTGVLETEKFARDIRIAGQDAAVGLAGLVGWANDALFVELDFEERWSLGTDADQLRLQATIGRRVRSATFLAQINLTESHAQTVSGGFNYDLGQVSLSSLLPLTDRWSVELGGRHDIHAEGLDGGSSAFLSFWYRP